MAILAPLLWGTVKLAVKYVAVPIAVSMATAVVADVLAQRMRERTAHLQGTRVKQAHLDIDPGLHPAP